MFNKLRNKFLIINATAIITVVLLSFLAIFLLTYSNVKKEVSIQLEKTLTEKEKISFDDKNISSNIPEKEDKLSADEKFSPPSISFSIQLNEKKEIISINNPHFNNITDDISKDLLATAISKNNNTDFFKYDDSFWAYQLLKTDDGYKMAFVDITNNVSVLINFIYAFLLVSVLSLSVIFLFSRYAANKAIKPIKDAFEKQKHFISDASHELKTPLTVINTNIDLILSNKHDTIENQEKWLNYIKSEGIRMAKLTNDLLYLAKIDNLDITSIHTIFNLSECIENTILPLEAVAFEKKLTLDYDITPDIYIDGNAEQIKQVAIILLDNAIRYSNDCGSITVNLAIQNKEAVLSVKNTGLGIEKENIDKVFDRFYRTDNSRNRQTGGHGLGLAIAKSIIDEHEGSIKISSIVNESTTFIVTFALAEH